MRVVLSRLHKMYGNRHCKDDERRTAETAMTRISLLQRIRKYVFQSCLDDSKGIQLDLDLGHVKGVAVKLLAPGPQLRLEKRALIELMIGKYPQSGT